MKKLFALLLLAALVSLPCWGLCCRCNSNKRTDENKNVHVSCKVGENKTPAKRIGIRQNFEGVVSKVSDGDTIWVKVEGQYSAVDAERLRAELRGLAEM